MKKRNVKKYVIIALAVFALVAIKSNHCLAYTQLADIPSLINDAHLTAYYKFEGNLNDSKSTHNGTWQGTGTYGTSTPFSGQYVVLNGTSQKFYLNRLAINNAVNTQSTSFWFNTSDNTLAEQCFFSNVGSSASNNLYPWERLCLAESYPTAGTHSVQFVQWTNDSSITHYQYASTTASSNIWHNYTMTRNGATADVKTYLDGNLTMAVNPAMAGANNYFTNANANIYIGADSTNYLQTTFQAYFKGKLDDISFWDRALTDSEIATIWSGGFCGDGICNAGETSATCPADCGYYNATTTIDYIWIGDLNGDYYYNTATTSLNSILAVDNPEKTHLYGHCVYDTSLIVYQRSPLPWYISYDRFKQEREINSPAYAFCHYSVTAGHTTELVYDLPISDANFGSNLYCIAEVNAWDDDAQTIGYVGNTPCANFNLSIKGYDANPSTATSTNIFGLSNYDLACTADEWASTSTIPILGWNVTLTICKIKLWVLDTLTKPISFAQTQITNFKNFMLGIFPFNIIENIRTHFNSSTAPFVSFIATPVYAAGTTFSTSTGVPSSDFVFTGNFGTGTPSMSFSFLSKANIVGVVGENTFDGIYLAIRIGIWILFIVYCYDLIVYRIHELFGNE